MGNIAKDFRSAYRDGSGAGLAAVLAPIVTAQEPHRLRSFYNSTNEAYINEDLKDALFQTFRPRPPRNEQNAWVEIFTAYWHAVGELLRWEDRDPNASAVAIFNAWKKLCNALIRSYSGSASFAAWTVPCLYTAGKYLRIFAIKADEEVMARADFGLQEDLTADSNAKMSDAALVINRMFTLCLNDRAPIEESRKWGLYNTANLLFKTYFKINSVSLTKNLLRAISAQSDDIPPMEAFPKSHIVTYKYYLGIIHFLDENYTEAEEHLTHAWRLCHTRATKNRELILTYLIPCHLVTTHTLPSDRLLAPFPRLEKLFRPLSNCIRKGDLVGFDLAMSAGEDEFVKRRIYLPLERGRDIALRNLFRKVFIAGGFEEPKEGEPAVRRTRVPVAEFAAALRIGTHATGRTRVDIDEVECLLANLIYKGLMKGYIARERGIVVMSKNNSAFPGTGI
ncbi:hypothetical protein N7492_001009 [Penicillium capsulatum]|uniref:Protein CSN12 homolog n=1 Tax=Penicillium capsulatum TaxID=69766 RepID=A0A9W9ISE1_9EURO|nr:hypothetical protein N7492_001009 [Penicillium capsulatum]KAJ6129931.1 hypothetical protein N7512_002711 [Penicillium capsulatum]